MAVTIRTSVKSIGEGAFQGCCALVGVTFPTSVESIGGWACYGCSALVEVTISTPVKTIGDWTFYGCSALAEETIALTSLESIGRGPFEGCHADLVLNVGAVTDIDTYSHFPDINGVARSAMLVHQLPGTGRCTVRCVWPRHRSGQTDAANNT